MSFKLITSIVPRNNGELITAAANKAGAGGGTILLGKGTAASGILQLLGLGDSAKDITFTVVDSSIYQKVFNHIVQTAAAKKAHFGVLFGLDVNNIYRAGSLQNQNSGDSNMDNTNNSSYELINIIVNKGYADDAMAAARKAGAGGGTIINARGTAKEGDAQFFGMHIVPEKEMLMILVPSQKKQEIINAVQQLPCFAQTGSGIIFCQQAQDFTILGQK